MGLRTRFKELLGRVAVDRPRPTSPFNIRVGDEPPRRAPPVSAPAPEGPPARTVVRAQRILPAPAPIGTDGPVRIVAEPQPGGDQCRFLLDRPLLSGHAWRFGEAPEAAGSPRAEALFRVEGVAELLIDDTTLLVTRTAPGSAEGWRPMASAVGRAVREHLEAGEPAVDPTLIARIPPEPEIRARIQRVIDEEVNPGVAAHSGVVTLLGVRGNSVTIRMGGGCQGCSAADLTLRQGIQQAFRTAVPELGGIYDETDHAAGQNPFFR